MSDRTTTPWLPEPGADQGYVQFAKDRRVEVDDGTTIAYTVRGQGGAEVPLVFANGWSCSDSYWVHLVPRFVAAGHPCVIPDTRGHGASGLPRPPGRGAKGLRPDDLSIPRMAADLVAVLDDADIERAAVVGHSMGVQTALEAYRQGGPERVAALVLVAGTYENPMKTLYGTPLADVGFPVLRTVMRWAPEVAWPLWSTIGNAKVGTFGAKLARAAGTKATPEAMHPYLLHMRACDPAVLILAADAMRRHSAADLLGRIEVPTLVLAAGKDVFTPARCSTEMAERIPEAELVVYPDAAHTLPIEEPEAIAAAVLDFLDHRLGPPRGRRKG